MPTLTTDLVVGPGQLVTLDNGYIVASGATVSFTNEGTVDIEGADQFGMFGFIQSGNGPNALFWNKAGATFSVTSTSMEVGASGISGSGSLADITNDGLIEITAHVNAFGIRNDSYLAFVFNNNGILRVTATVDWAIGIRAVGAINNTGEIDVAAGGRAVGVTFDTSTTLTNSGLIRATSNGATASVAVELLNAMSGETVVTNTAGGTIEGDFALKERLGALTNVGGRQVLDNAGTVNGIVDPGLADDEVHNTGVINGTVALGQGADVYAGGGTLNGALYGGFGNDALTGGAVQDVFYGEEGNDVIDGAGGDDILDGGHDDDTLMGGLAADQLYGGYGDDVLHGGEGNDELDGWQGADILHGDAGADTIVISKAAYSTGLAFDTAVGFDFAQDKIRVSAAPTVINAPIAGHLSDFDFAVHLAAAASPANLSANGAVLFSVNAGSYNGSTFLIVDANGVAGYQDGADIVLRLETPANTNQLALSTFASGGSTYNTLPLEFTSSPSGQLGLGREVYGDFTIHAEETLTVQDKWLGLAIYGLGTPPPPITVSNAGTVSVHSAAGSLVVTGVGDATSNPNQNSTFSNKLGAQFSVEAASPAGDMTAIGAQVLHFENIGDFTVTSTGHATGVYMREVFSTYYNAGAQINVTAAGNAVGIFVHERTNKTAEITNLGTLRVEAGPNATAVGVEIRAATASFTNWGNITINGGQSGQSAAILYGNFVSVGFTPQTFNNFGVLQAAYAIREMPDRQGESIEIINNAGFIIGKVFLGGGNDEVHNSRDMAGDIDLGFGNDLYDGALGQILQGRVIGGEGNDTMTGGAGVEQFDGGNGNDTLNGGGGEDILIGGAGADALDGDGGTDLATYAVSGSAVSIDLQGAVQSGGDAAGDTLVEIENLVGSAFNDNLFGDGVANAISGLAGNDFIQGRAGADTISGGDGDDWIDGGTGGDTIDGGTGDNDTAAYGASTAAVNLDLQANVYSGGDAAGDVLSGIEGVSGSAFADQLFGNGSNNRLFGQGGADFIQGRAGNDLIDGGDGDDWLDGGTGADQIFGGAGANDIVAYGASTTAVNADLAAFVFTGGDAAGDTYSGVEGVSGSAFADQLFGDANANRLFGQGGNDFIQGRAGADLIDGGDGDDWLDGGTGADQIFGGNGANDIVAYGASTSAVNADLAAFVFTGGDAAGDTYSGVEGVSGSSFADQLFGDANANRLFGQGGNDFIQGRAGNDLIDGGDGDDWLDGGLGGDQIFGGNGTNDVVAYGASTAAISADLAAFTFTGGDATGDTYSGVEGVSGSAFNDVISGNASANRLFGQGGNDTLAGRGGNDLLTGGANDDTFVFADNGGADQITDFDDAGNDLIQLSITGVTTFGQVSAVMTQVGADVLIDFATTDILLLGTTLATVQTDDFVFV